MHIPQTSVPTLGRVSLFGFFCNTIPVRVLQRYMDQK